MYFQKEWFKFEVVAPALSRVNVYQAWDFALGEKNQNDYTVGVTLLQDDSNYLHLVEIVRFKADMYAIVEQIIDTAIKWGTDASCPLTLGVEDGNHWKAFRPFFLNRCAERNFFPAFEELKTLTDKMQRARQLQGRLQQGRLWMLQDAGWTNTVVKEMLRFPAGAHDDIVDALAHAVNLCVDKSPPLRKMPRKLPSWRDRIRVIGRGGHMQA
jgi:predicted phage terminase large subunit-like protein